MVSNINIWKGFSDTDLIPNIQKLALFNRTMRLTKQAKEFIEFDVNKWDVVVDGIIRKPKEALTPLLEYKVNSTQINEALSDATKMTPEIQKKVDAISKYLDAYVVKKDFTVYRGEEGYGILSCIKIADNLNLGDALEKFTLRIKNNNLDNNIIEEFIDKSLRQQIIIQPRFMSTAMTLNAINDYVKAIIWNIKIPINTKGASIESFNIERKNEAEFLLPKNSFLLIKGTQFNKQKKYWDFEGQII